MRQTWDKTWLQIANTLATRSRCTNRQVGAVIVDENNRPIAVGYNGPPANFVATESCKQFCPRSQSQNRTESYDNCVSVHAEANALLFADRRLFKAATMYVTNPCCFNCSKLIANSGITRVVMQVSEIDAHASWDKTLELFKSCQITTEIIKKDNDAI